MRTLKTFLCDLSRNRLQQFNYDELISTIVTIESNKHDIEAFMQLMESFLLLVHDDKKMYGEKHKSDIYQ